MLKTERTKYGYWTWFSNTKNIGNGIAILKVLSTTLVSSVLTQEIGWEERL